MAVRGNSMSSRYQVLSNSRDLLYTEGSPVLLCAKALTKDSANGKVLAQIRFRNIGKGSLTGLTIELTPKDVAGRVMGEPVQHTYLDINIPRGGEFGANNPVYFTDETVREYDVTVVEGIVNGVVVSVNQVLGSVPTPEPLHFDSPKMLGQYQKDIKCPNARYKCRDIFDLWQCACGEFNHRDEQRCYSCHVDKAVLQAEPDIPKMQEEIVRRETAEREEKERQEKIQQEEHERELEERRIRNAAEKKKRTKIAVVAAVSATVIFAVIFGIRTVNTNRTKELIGSYIEEGNYADANNTIINSKLSDKDKESCYIQLFSKLCEDGNYSGAKKYIDDITSDGGKEQIARIQADYFLAGAFENDAELKLLRNICLENGTITKEQADTAYLKMVQTHAGRGGWSEVRRGLDDIELGTEQSDEQLSIITDIIDEGIQSGHVSYITDLLVYKVNTYGCSDENTRNEIDEVLRVTKKSSVKIALHAALDGDTESGDSSSAEDIDVSEMAQYVSAGYVPFKYLLTARAADITFDDEWYNEISDKALRMFDLYEGAYKYYKYDADKYYADIKYYVLDAEYLYIGSSRFAKRESVYIINEGSIGYLTDSSVKTVLIEKGGYLCDVDGTALTKIDESELPMSY